MDSSGWAARIELPGGVARFTGFLVAPRYVLTWGDLSPDQSVQVSLHGDPIPRQAKVVDSGRMAAGDDGTLIVLELPDPATCAPAKLAPLRAHEIYDGKRLFVVGSGGDGRQPRRIPATIDGSVWTQGYGLDLTPASPTWRADDFRGAPILTNTGLIAGMMNDPSQDRMVPTAEMASRWQALNGWMTFGSFPPEAYKQLREVLEPVRPPNFRRLLKAVRGRYEVPETLTSLMGIAEALVVDFVHGERDDDIDTEVTVLAWLFGFLTKHLPDLRPDLVRWQAEHLWDAPTAEPEPADEPVAGAVVVQILPTAEPGETETFELTVWTAFDPGGALSEQIVFRAGLDESRLPEEVGAATMQAMQQIPIGVDPLTVEFVLPNDGLSWPVDEWPVSGKSNVPMGIAKPVVVRDLDWASADDLRDLVRRVLAIRRAARGLDQIVQWRDCADEVFQRPEGYPAWLRRPGEPLGLGLTGVWTEADRIADAVRSGVPLMIWPRGGCDSTDHRAGEICVGVHFHRELVDRLAGVTFDTVAERVREIRGESAMTNDGRHWGQGITLLRDDGLRRPMMLEPPMSPEMY